MKFCADKLARARALFCSVRSNAIGLVLATVVYVACAVAASAEVGPGKGKVDAIFGSLMFSDICAKTLPRFRSAPSVLAKMRFKQSPETGTYFHQSLDMSVKLFEQNGRQVCSMVFSSREEPMLLAMMFGTSVISATNSDNALTLGDGDDIVSVALPRGAKFRLLRQVIKGRKLFHAYIILRN